MKSSSVQSFSALIFLTLAVNLLSCREEENPNYTFKEQSLSGKIGNTPWSYSDGFAELRNNELFINLFPSQGGHRGCEVFIAKSDEVFFILPKKEGVHKLAESVYDINHSITLLDFEDATNHLATQGAIEITSISEDKITGKIDAWADPNNFVNGTFSIAICQ